MEYLFGKSEKDQSGGLENNININLGYPGMQIGHVGGLAGSPTNKLAGYSGFQQRRAKSEDLIHQFLQDGDNGLSRDGEIGLSDFPFGSSSQGQKYSAAYVKILKQIAADQKLTHDMKTKLFKTAYSLVAVASGMVSHHNILGLRGNPKSYSVFRSTHGGRHYEVSPGES